MLHFQLSSVSQQLGRDPHLVHRHLRLGRQNQCFITMIVIYGSPNCVFFRFMGRQLPNVENHWSKKPCKKGFSIFWTCFVVVVVVFLNFALV